MSDAPSEERLAKQFLVSGTWTVPQGGDRFRLVGLSGGGGGGGGAEGRSGTPGLSSALEETAVSLVSGATYVALVGAGALGGAGAGKGEEIAGNGCAGGVTCLLGAGGFFVLLGTRPTSPSASTHSAPTPGTVSEAVGAEPRFAIVDDSGVVDNVIVATIEFFDDERVQDLVLSHRIVAEGGSLALKARSSPARAVQLQNRERVSPGWYLASATGAASSRFIEPEINPLPQPLRGMGGGRGAKRRRLSDQQLRFLAVATEWSSQHGGVSTVNRSICCALAQNGHSVACLVPHGIEEDERRSAAQSGVHLIECPETKGKGLGDLSSLLRRPQLPDGFEPDVLLGHGHVTGGAALIQRQDHFPLAVCVHIVHTQPEEIEWYKDRQRNASARVDSSTSEAETLARASALVLGVGPRLARQAQTYLHGLENAPPVAEIAPGLEDWSEGATATPPPEVRCLFVGRAEDGLLKGLDIALAAVARVAHEHSSAAGPALIIRGVPSGDADKLHREHCSRFPAAHLLRVFEFNSDENAVRRSYREASLVLVPSRSEGFGLVALEAVSAGIPILVSERSGFAEMIQRDYSDFTDDFVVNFCDADAIHTWGNRVKHLLSNREHFFARVRQLRAAMRAASWSNAATSLVAALRSIPPE
jgi:glycosyltransferase involved in cell wall biosynthesis